MGLFSSPSLKEYKGGLPNKPRDPAGRQRVLRLIIGILVLVVLGLMAINFIRSGAVNLLVGQGTLTGRVLDQKGNPLKGTVYVMGVDRPVALDSGGGFIYANIPAGQRKLIVAQNGTAQAYPVQVLAGTSTDVGELLFIIVTPGPQP